MRRISLWLMTLALLALPALARTAQSTPATPACGAAAFLSSSTKGAQGAAGTYQPLAPGQRLFYSLTGLGQDSPLEVRYLVQGKPFLTEIVDLAKARLPIGPEVVKPKLDPLSFLKEERLVELLALRPDLLLQLHKLVREEAPIKIEIRQQGRLFESLSFQDLTRRSAELVKNPGVLLAVQSTVSGPGDHRRAERQRPLFAKDYLESCNDCTETTPCDTECGWDPGKGGPETCGEYGAPCASTCSCSYTPWEHWSDWYYIGSYTAGPSYCYVDSAFGGSSWFQYYVQQYRRDRIRTTYICPNCPSCSGCYFQDEVISYQTGYSQCLYDTYSSCFSGATACCSALCSFSSYCNSSC
jgi:hypothetical protein